MRVNPNLLLLLLLAACTSPGSPLEADVNPEGELGSSPEVGEVAARLMTQWRSIGQSFEGRSIEVATLGSGPGRLYLVGGIHGDERAGLEALPWLRERLLEGSPDPGLEPGFSGFYTVRALRDANPDGTYLRTRANARGVDLNRNFPASNFIARRGHGPEPLSESESACLLADLHAFEPDLVVAFHSASQGPFVNYDGPAERFASAFVAGARRLDPRWHIQPDMGYPTPGSLGSLLGVDAGLPVLTIEFPKEADGADCWPALEAGMARLLQESP